VFSGECGYYPDVDVRFVRPAPVNPVSLQVAQAISRSGLSYREVARRAGLEDAALAQLADPFFTGQTLLTMQRLADALRLTMNVTFDELIALPPGTIISATWQGNASLLLDLRDVPEVAAAPLPLVVRSEMGTLSLLQRRPGRAGAPSGRMTYEARLLDDRR